MPNMAQTVMRLEKDKAPKPERPWPEVQPVAILAPYAMANPPTKADDGATTEEEEEMVATPLVNARLPPIMPRAKMMALGGKGGLTILLLPRVRQAYRPI